MRWFQNSSKVVKGTTFAFVLNDFWKYLLWKINPSFIRHLSVIWACYHNNARRYNNITKAIQRSETSNCRHVTLSRFHVRYGCHAYLLNRTFYNRSQIPPWIWSLYSCKDDRWNTNLKYIREQKNANKNNKFYGVDLTHEHMQLQNIEK